MKRLLFLFILLFARCASNDPAFTPPTVTTLEPTDLTLSSATVGGTVEAVQPELITMKGVCWSRNANPELDRLSSKTENGAGAGSFSANLTGLSVNKYYVRAYAKANGQVFYGNEVVMNIAGLVPALVAAKKGNIGLTGAEIETTITYAHSLPVLEKGITWGTADFPTVETGTKIPDTGAALAFTSQITGLMAYKAYYVRSYATTELGTFYGNSLTLLILPAVSYGSVTDIDGNVYKTTAINGKEWMAENLKVTKYRDGTPIVASASEDQFRNASSGAYISYGNSVGNVSDFGYLYNGHAVTNDKNVCMTGWHMPTASEWSQMANSLGGAELAGGHMKAVSNLWSSPNTAATNESGFSALPGGSYCRICLSNTGLFADKGTDGYWWSAAAGSFFYCTNDLATLRTKSTGSMNDGLSVRCVKD